MNAPERIWAKGNTIDYDLTRWSTSRWNGDTEYIRADLVPQWQPIETAPKDGTEILTLRSNGHIAKAIWYDNPFGRTDTVIENASGKWWSVTHWMPLPTPPQPTARHST